MFRYLPRRHLHRNNVAFVLRLRQNAGHLFCLPFEFLPRSAPRNLWVSNTFALGIRIFVT